MARDEHGNVVFDTDEQAKVDQIVQERLARAKADKPADYDDLAAIREELRELGYEGTPAQVRERIQSQKAQAKTQRDLEAAQQKALRNGTSPELEVEIARLKAKVDEQDKYISTKTTEEREAQARADQDRKEQETWDADVKELHAAHPGVNIKDLEKDERFLDYAEGKGKKRADGSRRTLLQIYDQYQKFIGAAADDGERRARDKETRSTGGGSAGDGRDYGLTVDQKRNLDKWNRDNPHMKMTEKEYASRM